MAKTAVITIKRLQGNKKVKEKMNNSDYTAAFVPPIVIVECAVSRNSCKNGQYLQNIEKYYNYDHLFSFDCDKN